MPSELQPVRFGLFEVNLDRGEVRRASVKVRMQEQPFQNRYEQFRGENE